MVQYDYNKEKDRLVRLRHGVSFKDIIQEIKRKRVLKRISHPNKTKYSNQKLYIIEIKGYAIVVPHVEQGDTIFLKTLFPSRKYTKKFIKRKEKYE